ncbi:M50 family metallopeptidase [Cellulomonas endophytica]|uniref:M50 family metallopeptidase n=1 Tax=Cellulomonas endophytica TaxID=2494735 RepID=UPI001F0BDC76|nr:M50 family metallopeptidase [Cellulomonas endophytica]
MTGVPGPAADALAALTAVAAPLPRPHLLLTALLVAAVLVLPRAWHVARHGLTIVHEAAHGVVAVLVGRRLAGIRVHSDTSGLTVSRGRPRGPGMVATLLAGYPGPAVVGLGAAALLAQGRAVAVLWGLLLVVALVLVQIRNLYGLWAVLASGAVLAAVTVAAPEGVRVLAAHAVTLLLLAGAPRAVLELARERRRVRRSGRRDVSDAGQLATLTHVPGAVWVLVLLAVCLAALAVGARWLWFAAA